MNWDKPSEEPFNINTKNSNNTEKQKNNTSSSVPDELKPQSIKANGVIAHYTSNGFKSVREYYTSEDSSRTTSKLKEFWNSEGKIVATEYEKE